MNAVTHWLIGGVLLMALTTASADSRAKNMPDSINLDSMEHLYEKVNFNHAGHIRLIKDCAVCHHHTTGTLVEDTNCVRCHNVADPSTFSDVEWEVAAMHMQIRANLTTDEIKKVTEFLQSAN